MNVKREYKVTGMSCAACSARVERTVGALDSVDACEVNLLLGTMSVAGDAEDSAIISAVRDIGYGIEPYTEPSRADGKGAGETKEAVLREQLLRLILSLLLLTVLMYISMGHLMWGFYLPPILSENPIAIGIVELLLSLGVMIINKRFFVSGAKAALRLTFNMDTLVALGSLSSFLYSLAMLFLMTHDMTLGNTAAVHASLHGLYFESCAMIPALISLGKLLEERAKGKTTAAIDGLVRLVPRTVRVIRDGEESVIDVSELRRGDIFAVRRGEAVGADGEITEGEGSFDEACLTGESIPPAKGVGDKVYGGTNLTAGYVKVRATGIGEETVISKIIKTVREASSSKAPVAKLADKVAGVFVPVVLAIAFITCIVHLIIGQTFGYSLARAVSVLVISCPCALGLATPTAIMVGSGVGAGVGVLFKNAAALEMAGRIKIAAIDKTGTVTEGRPSVSDIIPISVDKNELITLAASLEAKSEHPLGVAIAESFDGEYLPCEHFSQGLGGVRGTVGSRRIIGGNLEYIEREAAGTVTDDIRKTLELISADGKTALLFAEEGRVLGIIALSDRIKEDSAHAIAELRRMNIRTVMLTGDNAACAERIAREVGIDEVFAGIFPSEKESRVRGLMSEGRVCMIGDGVNDAPSLVTADLGIAIGAGTNVAIDSADVVLVGSTLTDAVNALALGRKTLRNIKQNLFWAFIYNIIGIPLAAGVFIPLGLTLEPMFGALAMSVSSFIVVMNALRLNLFKPIKNTSENKTNENKTNESEKIIMNTVTLKIEGMMCPHCSGRVRSALEALEGVSSADVSHERGDAVVVTDGKVDRATLVACVTEAGYKCE
ncbi:MAG: heavy metal translocating P-type ATPase [Clostridia bacterium]|nr:heavy metal translocating P-type ATPase [Clostridia bacterium]